MSNNKVLVSLGAPAHPAPFSGVSVAAEGELGASLLQP